MILDDRISRKILDRHQQLLVDSKLRPQDKLDQYYATFKSKFGPERLANLDGRALLYAMHALDRTNRDSLVYWLEFKNDSEFPGIIFGSIAGGSALKYCIYQRADDGQWITGSPQNQRIISEDEAIGFARSHRDQLLRGAELLSQLPDDTSDEVYKELQSQLDALCPDIRDTAWGHKYLSLLYSDRLDDYHVSSYQRFYLIKLLQVPPAGEGRYLAAGPFVRIARELGIPMNHLTSTLGSISGRPHRYWRVLANYQEDVWKNWEEMSKGGFVTIAGWAELGDLSGIAYSREGKSQLREKYETAYKTDGRRWTQEVFNFVCAVQEGDIVIAGENPDKILGIGGITGPYFYEPSSKSPHRHPVEWLTLHKWERLLPVPQASPFRAIETASDLVEIEKHILDAPPSPPGPGEGEKPLPSLTGVSARIQSILERKGQVILYGPPGTGKTYWAEKTAHELAARSWFDCSYYTLSPDQKSFLSDGTGTVQAISTCCFHPAYGYEDFLEGYRPEPANGHMNFVLRDGIFKRLCKAAQEQPNKKFYLIVDEINRGDIPRIFGELLMILEKDKRGKILLLPLTGEPFQVPANVYLVGTMNTADRSIALLDVALRRRFGFVEIQPDPSVLGDATVGGIPLGPWLASLNERVRENVGRDARNLQIGHSYLMQNGHPITDFGRFAHVLREDIIPLLEEYCYEDYSRLEKILGKAVVDSSAQQIRDELFDPARRDDLIQALRASDPLLAASPEAVAAEAAAPPEEPDESDSTPSVTA